MHMSVHDSSTQLVIVDNLQQRTHSNTARPHRSTATTAAVVTRQRNNDTASASTTTQRITRNSSTSSSKDRSRSRSQSSRPVSAERCTTRSVSSEKAAKTVGRPSTRGGSRQSSRSQESTGRLTTTRSQERLADVKSHSATPASSSSQSPVRRPRGRPRKHNISHNVQSHTEADVAHREAGNIMQVTDSQQTVSAAAVSMDIQTETAVAMDTLAAASSPPTPLNNNVSDDLVKQNIHTNTDSDIGIESNVMDTIRNESDKENADESVAEYQTGMLQSGSHAPAPSSPETDDAEETPEPAVKHHEKILISTPIVGQLEQAPAPVPMMQPQQHVVIKVQKAAVMPNGSMSSPQMVTIPLVMTSCPGSSEPGMAQVYTFPAGAAPIQVSLPSGAAINYPQAMMAAHPTMHPTFAGQPGISYIQVPISSMPAMHFNPMPQPLPAQSTAYPSASTPSNITASSKPLPLQQASITVQQSQSPHVSAVVAQPIVSSQSDMTQSLTALHMEEQQHHHHLSMVAPQHHHHDTAAADLDDAKVRKSARLTGKVPGWKTFLREEQAGDVAAVQLMKPPRKRRMMRAVSQDTEPDSDMDVMRVSMESEMDEAEEALKRQRVGKEDFPCDVCGKSFTSEKYLSMHSALHVNQNQLPDDILPDDLKDGEGYLKSGNTWMCKICSKVFAQNSSFKNHMRTHSDERPYVCQICSIGFKERYHLKKHQLFKHSTELKEKCRFCGKRFKDSTAVRAHERIHSEERPYSCRRCNKAFKTSECLWHHENRSKTCGAVAHTFPPMQRGRRGRPSRKQTKDDEAADLKPTIHIMNAPAQPMHHQLQPHHQMIMSAPPQQAQQVHVAPQQQVHHQMHIHMPPQQHQVKPATMELPTVATIQSHMPVVSVASCEMMGMSLPVSSPQVPSPEEDVSVKSEPMSEEEYYEELDLVNQVIESVQATTNMESILKDVEDGPLLNADGELLIPSEPDPPVTTSELITSLCDSALPRMGSEAYTTASTSLTSASRAIQSIASSLCPSQLQPPPAHAQPPHSMVTTLPSVAALASQLAKQPSGHMTSLPSFTSLAQNQLSLNQLHTQALSSGQHLKPFTAAPTFSKPSVAVSSMAASTPSSSHISLPLMKAEYSQAITSAPAAPGMVQTKAETVRPVATVQPVQRVAPVKPPPKQDEDSQPMLELQSHKGKMSNFTCPKCLKGFAVPSAFQKHLQRHEEVRPFHCEICDLGFKLKVHLKKHNLYRHSTEYPCECKICGKKFKDSSAVRLHERIHSEARPFHCGCGKTFKTKENLWGHQHRKMCPLASSSTMMSDDDMLKAEASVSNGHVTASIRDNRIIAQAIVSNNKVMAQAMIGDNGELTAHASVISHSQLAAQASLGSQGAQVKVENPLTSAPATSMSVPTISVSNSSTPEPVSSSHASLFTPAMVVTAPAKGLPSFEAFTSGMRSPAHSPGCYGSGGMPIKKESMADKCPTIQNLLKKGPTAVTTRLPGIQQLFSSHMKPPPPYPGNNNNNTKPASVLPPSSPGRYNQQRSAPAPVSPAPTQLMINPDQMYESSRGPYLRTPPPPPYKCATTAGGGGDTSPYSDYSPRSSTGTPRTPGTPGSSASNPAHDTSMPIIYWDDDTDRKPVLTQWQNQDSDTLFHELSNTVLNQL